MLDFEFAIVLMNGELFVSAHDDRRGVSRVLLTTDGRITLRTLGDAVGRLKIDLDSLGQIDKVLDEKERAS